MPGFTGVCPHGITPKYDCRKCNDGYGMRDIHKKSLYVAAIEGRAKERPRKYSGKPTRLPHPPYPRGEYLTTPQVLEYLGLNASSRLLIRLRELVFEVPHAFGHNGLGSLWHANDVKRFADRFPYIGYWASYAAEVYTDIQWERQQAEKKAREAKD